MHESPGARFYARFAIGIAAVAVFVVIASSVLSIRRLTLRFSPTHKLHYQPISERYEDEDGTATQDSEAAYSYQKQRVLVLVFSVIGLLDSLMLCVIPTQSSYSTHEIEQWLQFAAWVRVGSLEAMRNFANMNTRLSSSFKLWLCSSSLVI